MDSINLTGVQRGNNLLSFPFVKSDGTTYHTSEIAEVFANANLQIGGFIGFGVACKLVNNDWVGSGCDIGIGRGSGIGNVSGCGSGSFFRVPYSIIQ